MKAYNAKDIRNIAIAGHGGRGKTTLAEAMLYTAKATDRLGRVADGTTVLDFDAEEKKRKATVSTAVAGAADAQRPLRGGQRAHRHCGGLRL